MEISHIKSLKNKSNNDIYKDYKGNKLIHLILIHNRDDLLEEYISMNYDLNLTDKFNNTPYHLLLSQLYNPDKFIKIVNKYTCWNNKNSNEETILDLILTDNKTFNKLKPIHKYFMKKDILDNYSDNFINICTFLSEDNILKYQDIIDFTGDRPALFNLTHNNNISSLSKFIIKLNNYKKLLKIRNINGDNILGYFIFKNRENIDKYEKTVFNLIDLGLDTDYINPITGSQPFRYILLYSKKNNFIKKYMKYINFNSIDNFGNNLGHFIISLYQNKNKKPDDIFYYIIDKVDKKQKNISNINISSLFGNKYSNSKIDLNLIDIPHVHTTQFRARLDDILYHFKILDNKYKNICIPKFSKNISSMNLDFDSNYLSLPTDLDLHLDHLPFIVFYQDENTYFVHPYLNILIKNCMHRNDYAIVFLSIQDDDGNLHANLLLYNFKNNTIQRFEPYGNTSIIDGQIDNILEEELTWNLNMTYLKPSNITISSGLQSLSDDTNIIYQKPGDFGGFCLAWCIWFVEMVMKNKNINYSELISKSIKKIIKNKSSLIDYIRGYGEKISNEKYDIYKKIGLPETVWSNIVFNNSANHIIFSDLSKWLNIN